MSIAPLNELEVHLQRLAQRAQVGRDCGDFYAHLLGILRSLSEVENAAAWLIGGDRTADQRLVPAGTESADQHWWLDTERNRERLLVDSENAEREADLLPADSIPRDCFVRPVVVGLRVVALIEIHRSDQPPDSESHSLQTVVEALTELAADWHRNAELLSLREMQTTWQELLESQRHLLAARTQQSLWHALTNEGCRVADCDRVTGLTADKRRAVVESVSGLDRVDRRSRAMQSLAGFITQLHLAGLKHWNSETQSTDQLDSPRELGFSEYAATTQCTWLYAVRLDGSHPTDTDKADWLVFECFGADVETSRLMRRAERFVQTIAAPVASLNHVDHAANRGRWGRRMLALVMLAALIVALLTPVPFRIRGDGELMPVTRAEIYAPAVAEVEQLLATDRTRVRQDEPLLQLRSQDLDDELSRLLGELETAGARQAAIQSERVRLAQLGQLSGTESQRLSAEERELEAFVAGLKRQQALVEQRQQELLLSSPIDGTVLTWDFEQLLANRPVETGQRLMTVANLDGDWVVDLMVSDEDIGVVRENWQEGAEDVPIQLVMATNPEQPVTGKLQSIAAASELNAFGETVVRVRVAVERDQIGQALPGSTVIGRFQCGVKPLGWVLSRDLVRRVREWAVF